jgi:hypothetical protein
MPHPYADLDAPIRNAGPCPVSHYLPSRVAAGPRKGEFFGIALDCVRPQGHEGPHTLANTDRTWE